MSIFLYCVYFAWFICLCEADQEKVFGGRFARKGEFPSAVAVVEKMMCGGTIVTMDKVLTAAHCMINKISRVPKPISGFRIYGGSLTVPFPPKYLIGDGLQERRISKVKIHEGNSGKKDGSSYHDIALIILSEPFVQTKTLSVAKFPSKDEKGFSDAWEALVESKNNCIGVGWGTTVYKKGKNGTLETSKMSEHLKAVDLTPLGQNICSKYTWEEDQDMTEKGEVCVSSNREKGESVCSGDSGSPLYCDGYAFALARATAGCGNETTGLFYLLYGPYIAYFGRLDHKENHPDLASLLFTNGLFITSLTLLTSLNSL